MSQPSNEVNAELNKVQTYIVHVDEMAMPREMLHSFSIQKFDALELQATKYSRSYPLQWLLDRVFGDVVQRYVTSLPNRDIDLVYTPCHICPDSRRNPFKEGEYDTTILAISKMKNWKTRKRTTLKTLFELYLERKGLNKNIEELMVWNWKKRKSLPFEL